MESSVRVELLGPVRALADTEPLRLRGVTARTVLARLALSAGSVVSADQLADALWGDDLPLDPSGSLRSTVSRLRAQLGRDVIVTEGAGYRLDIALVQLDLADLEAGISGTGRPHRDPDRLKALLGLWRGDALADVAWTAAFEPERARIEELRARLVDDYHNAMLATGRAEEALADLERDAAADPLRESTQLLLMRALHWCGRTADALRAGEAYRARLVEQTGIDPTPDYDALARTLLTPQASPDPDGRRPGAPPAAAAPPERRWAPPDTPFVGRDAELADLAQLSRQRRLVTVIGPGGVGKTRLVTESVAQAPASEPIEMVSLAALERGSSIDAAVATELGIEVSETDTRTALIERLRTRPSTLVLDNCEHVLAGARSLGEELLRSIPELRLIATSRRRIGLADEALLEVGPLALPPVQVLGSAPMQLFMDRVARAAPKLEISTRDERVAADICRLLEGLPLALELAAARIPMLGFDGLRERLLGGLVVPGARVADDDRRQATIESTVEWSLALLSPEARELFDEVSFFASWFDLRALERVSASPEAVDVFGEIHDSSLVVADHRRSAYRLLEPVRQVVARQVRPDHRTEIAGRYLGWVGSLVEAIDQHWRDDNRAAAQEIVIDHRADLRASLGQLAKHGDGETHGRWANILARALVERADIELIELCRTELGPSAEGRLARLLLAWNQGDHEQSAELVGSLEERIDAGHALWGYYNWAQLAVHLYAGDTERLGEAAVVAATDEHLYPSLRAESVALWACGLLYSEQPEAAAELIQNYEEVLGLSTSGGFVSYTFAELAAATGDRARAIAMLDKAAIEARAANGPFTQRLTEVSQLVLLVDGNESDDATTLALRLVPDLINAGTLPQAWTSMRHVADLLDQLDAPSMSLLIRDSAEADPTAPALTGAAVETDRQVRAALHAQLQEVHVDRADPMALGPLWSQVEATLRRRIDDQSP